MRYALAAAALLVLMSQEAARAEPVFFIEKTTASGTLGSTSFQNRLLIVTYLGDTANISTQAPGVLQDTGGIAAFYLEGVGAGIFNGGPAAAVDFMPPFTAAQQGAFSIGATSTVSNLPPYGNSQAFVVAIQNPAFANYQLNTSLGPVTGQGVLPTDPAGGGIAAPVPLPTTAGDLTLTSIGNVEFDAFTVGKPSKQ